MKRSSLLIGSVAIIAGLFYFASQYMKTEQKPKEEAVFRINRDRLVKPYSPKMGPETAKITLVEFLDPECEACARFYPFVKKILAEYDGQIHFVVRYMLFHNNSQLAAQATEAAGKQNKYWEMQAQLFERQHEWGGHEKKASAKDFEKIAAELGINMAQFRKDMNDEQTLKNILADFQEGPSVGVQGTPSFFVNGRMLYELSPETLKMLIDDELKK